MRTSLDEMNAPKVVNGWLFMGGIISGLAHESVFFKLISLQKDVAQKDDEGNAWDGEFIYKEDQKDVCSFLLFMGNSERDAILAKWSPDKIYQIERVVEPLPGLHWWDAHYLLREIE
jgi:hypothetical protein